MAGSNKPEFLGEGFAEAFAQAQFADEEPSDVDKLPLPEDGDQPEQDIVSGGTDV